MARQGEQHQNDAIVAAIERVLMTERDGVERLRASRENSQSMLAEARAKAAAIAQRSDTRVSNIHTAYLQKVERDIKALDRTGPVPGGRAGHRYERHALEDATRRVAAKLAGGE